MRNIEGYTGGCRANIDLSALRHNYRHIEAELLRLNGGRKRTAVAAVVKADAYGHGADICLPELYGCGCRFFVVATLGEAIDVSNILSEKEDTEILILQHTGAEYLPIIKEKGFIQSVFSEKYARELSAAADGEIKVHIKLDTGMNRFGFNTKDARACAEGLCKLFGECKNLRVCGIFSHFHTATDKKSSDAQYERFSGVLRELDRLGFEVGVRHLAASCGIFTSEDYLFDMVRVGKAIYGYGIGGVMPVMSLTAKIDELHRIGAGETVGYNAIFTAERDTVVATVGGGYADGIFRAYRGADVGVITKDGVLPARICGNICMDAFMVEIAPEIAEGRVFVGDEIVIFGKELARDSLTRLAHRAGTIEYESLVAAGRARGKRKVIS